MIAEQIKEYFLKSGVSLDAVKPGDYIIPLGDPPKPWHVEIDDDGKIFIHKMVSDVGKERKE